LTRIKHRQLPWDGIQFDRLHDHCGLNDHDVYSLLKSLFKNLENCVEICGGKSEPKSAETLLKWFGSDGASGAIFVLAGIVERIPAPSNSVY